MILVNAAQSVAATVKLLQPKQRMNIMLQQFIFFNAKTNAKIPNVTVILVPICFLGSKKQ